MDDTTIFKRSIEQPSPEEGLSQLIAKARQEPEKLGDLYLLYAQPIYRYLYSRIGHRQEAEDLTAQTFLAMVERFPTYNHRGYFAAWLFSIARNKVMDYFRQQDQQIVFEDANAIADERAYILENLIQSDRIAELAEQIALLPDDQQELIRLRYLAELSFAEMGKVLHKKANTVKKSLYRVMERLKYQLEKDHD